MKTTILYIFLVLTNIMCGQKDTLINGILFTDGPTLTDSIQKGLVPKFSGNQKRKEEQISIIDNKLCVKLAPLSMLDLYSGSSIRIGAEYKLKGRTSLYNEIGTYLPNFNGLNNNTGVIVKAEFKFYFNQSGLTSGNYISGELFYKYQTFSTWDTILIKPYYKQDYSVSKHVECFTIKFGTMEVFKKHFIFDYFIGAGVRVRQIKNSLTTDENNKIQSVGDYGINVARGMAGHYVYPNIDMGIKIGYRIK